MCRNAIEIDSESSALFAYLAKSYRKVNKSNIETFAKHKRLENFIFKPFKRLENSKKRSLFWLEKLIILEKVGIISEEKEGETNA